MVHVLPLAAPDGFAPHSTYDTVWTYQGSETVLTNALFFGGYASMIAVMIAATVINRRITKRHGVKSERVTRIARWLVIVAFVVTTVASLLTHGTGHQDQKVEAAILEQRWGLQIVDVNQLPGRHLAQNVPLTVRFGDNTVQCLLATYGKHTGDKQWYTNLVVRREAGRPLIKFQLWCPSAGDITALPFGS